MSITEERECEETEAKTKEKKIPTTMCFQRQILKPRKDAKKDSQQ